MTRLADLLSTVFERRYRPTTPPVQQDRSLVGLAEELVGSMGEVSGIALAREILSRFDPLDDDEKLTFFRHIAKSLDIDPDAVRTVLDAYQESPSRDTYRAFAEAA